MPGPPPNQARIGGIRVKNLLLIALCSTLAAGAAFTSASAAATATFVTGRAPAGATVEEFKTGSLAVTVTCQRACSATVFATIRASQAKRLGLEHVQGKFVLVGTGKKALTARMPTKIRVVPTAWAKKHLTPSVDVVGSVKGVPTAAGSVNNYFVGWYTRLS